MRKNYAIYRTVALPRRRANPPTFRLDNTATLTGFEPAFSIAILRQSAVRLRCVARYCGSANTACLPLSGGITQFPCPNCPRARTRDSCNEMKLKADDARKSDRTCSWTPA